MQQRCVTALIGAAALMSCRLDYELLNAAGAGGSQSGAGAASSSGGASTSGGTEGSGASSANAGSSAAGASTGASGGSSSTGGSSAASGGTGGVVQGDFHVDSTADDDTVGGPMTLREAVNGVNAAGSPQTITFDPDLTIPLQGVLPQIDADVTIIGDGTQLDFEALNTGTCLRVQSGTVVIRDLEITNCPGSPIAFEGGMNHQVSACYLHDNGGSLRTTNATSGNVIGPDNRFEGGNSAALSLDAPGDQVRDNTFLDIANYGVFLGGSADGSLLVGNLFVRTTVGIQFSTSANDVTIWHNSFVGMTNIGVNVGGSTGVDIRNNVITQAGQFGLNANAPSLAFLDHNLYFQNGSGGTVHCNGCQSGLGANSLVGIDPAYVNAAGDDYRLQDGSDATDGGFESGEDRNGAGAGLFFGLAPDLGFAETNY